MSDQLLGEALATIDRLDARLVEAERQLHEPIAIVGIGCRFPEADGPRAFWELLRAGVDASREITRWKLDTFYDASREAGKSYTKRASLLSRIDEFEPSAFQITPREAEAMDPQQRLLLEVASEAIDDAALSLPRLQALSTGVFVGVGQSDYIRLEPNMPLELLQYASIGNLQSIAAGRISYVFGLTGPCIAIDTACSASLVAIHTACESLRLRTSDVALAGGVNALSSSAGFVVLSSLTALSPDGRCKAWDASADGYGRGEGCGMVVLKRLSDARRDGDRIWALIRGSAINSDGRSSGLTAPNPQAQERVIRAALAHSRIEPSAVQYIEGHGTGTVLGDPIEVEALASVFSPREGAPLAIGTVKTNIGHLEAGAGVAGLIKTALAVHHRALPASLHVRTPNPHIEWASLPIRVQTELGAWPTPSAPLVAGVSSFGLSGTNAHVVVEEPPPEDAARAAEALALAARGEPHVLVISAKTDAALRAYAESYADMLEAPARDDRTYRDIAYTASARATQHDLRLAVVGTSSGDWAAALRGYLAGDISARVATGVAAPRRVAMVFGGQGSQWYAMGRELLRDEPVFRAAVERVAALVDPQVSWKLVDELSRDEATSRIEDTEIAQPALFALQVGLVALWAAWGVEPIAVAGHSLGEITAAHVAGALTLEQAARLVIVRGKILQRATGQGRMATVTASATETASAIAGVAGVEIAASNASRSTTICGPADAIEQALATLAKAGVDAKLLKVNYAFHHAMLAPLAAELTEALRGLAPAAPRIAMISTVTGGKAPRLDAAYWGSQVRQQVRFEEATRALIAARCDTFIEIGAHPVLSPAIAQTAEETPVVVVPSLRRKESEATTMRTALAALHCAGVAIDWSRQFAVPGRVATLPRYPWQRQRGWVQSAAPRVAPPVAPLIDRRTELPHAPGTHLFELDRAEAITPNMLVDLAAESVARVRGGTTIQLTDVRFEPAAAEAEPRSLQVVVHADGRFEIFTRADGGAAARCAAGRFGGERSTAWPSLAELRHRCARDATDEIADDAGILETVFAGDTEALGRVRVATVAPPSYELDPAVLAAAWQMLDVVDRGRRLPVQIEALTISQRAAAPAWISMRWSGPTSGGARSAELAVLDDRGRVIAAARGVRLESVRSSANGALDQWLYRVAWRDVARTAKADARGPWLVLADRGGVGASLRAALEAAGQRVVTAEWGSSSDDPAHLTRLLDEAFPSDAPRRIVHLWSLDASAPSADGLTSSLHLMQAVAKRTWAEAPRIFIVTRGAQATRDGEAVPGVAQSAVWGFGASVVQEMPELATTLIDLDPARTDAHGLYDEVTRVDREDRIAIREGARRVARVERCPRRPASAPVVRSDRTYVVTGGAGALGLVSAAKLVELGARHVALVGRTAPSDHARAQIAALEAAGATVHVVRGDVADAADVARVLADVRARMPALGGVVHAAGVIEDGVITNLDAAQVARVLAPKLLGAWNLHTQTATDALELFVLFGSAAGVLGAPGQAHYAGANAFLDALAHHRRALQQPALALDWGPWADIGMARGLAGTMMRSGMAAISPADGAELFARLVGDGAAQVAIMDVRWRHWRQANPRAASMPLLAEIVPSVPAAGGANEIVERIRGATAAQRAGLVEEYVRGAIGKVTGTPTEQIRGELTLRALGLDSLMMISLRSVVLREVGVSIPLRQLFQTLTVAGLAGEIRSRFQDDTVSVERPVLSALAIDVADVHATDSTTSGAALVRADRSGVLPLSFVQERQWFVQQLDPSRVFNLSRSVSITGPLQVDALEQALTAIIARHEPLRTTFAQVDGHSVYVIAPPRAAVLPVIDVTEHADRDAEVARILAGEDLHRLDVVEGPVLRVRLIRKSANEHVLTVVAHHAVFDAASFGVFWKDLSDAYAALSRAEPWRPPALAIQSVDVAAWERGWLTGDRLDAQLSYWTGRLAGLPQLDLPTDRPRPAVLGTVAGNHVFSVPRGLVGELEAVSRRAGVTLFSTLLSAYATVLSRYADQRDFVIGVPVSMRDRPELVPLIGLFVNALPVRVELANTVTIRDLVHRTQQTLYEGLEHKEVPLAQLIERLRLRRDLSRYLLFQATMTVFTADAPQIAGLEVREIQGAAEGAEAEVTLSFAQLDGGELQGSLLYRSDLFEPATIATFAGYFLEVLEAFAHTGWDQPFERLPAAPEERPRAIAPATPRRIVVAATYTADPIAKPLALWFDKLQLHAAVELAPYNQIFQELLDPTSAVGRTDAQGVNVLLIRLEDWTGLSYEETVGINQFSEEALASIEVITGELIAALAAAAKRSPTTFVVCVSPISKAARSDLRFSRVCARAEERLVGAFSTTSNVRVVPSFETLADPALDYDDPEANRLGHVPYSPSYFATLGTLIARRIYRLVTPPKKVIALDADQTLWRGVCGEVGPDGIALDAQHVALQQFMIERSKAGMLLCLCSKNNEEDVAEVFARRPEMPLKLEHLVARRVNWQPKSMNLRSLADELSLGLDSFIFVDDDPAVCAEVEANCPEVLTLRIPTDETLPRFLANVWAFDTAPATEEDAKRTALYQQNSARARLQDSSSSFVDFLASLDLRVTIAPMRPDQLPRVAQLTTRTNQFNTTTIRRTERELEVSGLECITVEVTDKFGDYGLVGVVLLHAVADALVVDSMLLSCRALGRGVEHRMLARVGEIARQRGLARVDVRFAKSAKNAPALGFLDSTGGAYLVTGPGGDTYRYPTEIAASLVFMPGDTAPEVPRDEAKATPVRAPRVPWSDVARELYDATRVMEAMSAARGADALARAEYVAPRTPEEERIAEIWSELLDGRRVGIHDDFFEVGGHSLLAIQLLARIERRLGVKIPLRELFVVSTLGGLAARMGEARTTTPSGDVPALVPTGRRRGRLLAPQRGSYLVERAALSVGQNRGVVSTWLDGPLDIVALEHALHTLRERHVILRTRFFEEDGELWQEILENPAATILERADVSTLADAERERADAALVDELLRRPFDFERGELARAVLTTWSPVRHRLTIALHHITWDPQSIVLFEKELYTLWHAYATDPASAATALLPPTASSIDLVDYLDRVAQTPAGERTRAYWRATLEGATPIAIPSDLPREAVDARRSAYDGFAPFPSAAVSRDLGPEETADLKRIAQTANASLLSVLLASLCSELTALTGQDDLAIVGHLLLRHIPGLERSMGYFANPLILRVSTAGAPTTTELIARTHDSVTAAFEHGDFDVLREASHLFRVHVSYQYVDHRGDSRGEPALLPDVVRSTVPFRPSQQPEIPYDVILFISATPDRIQLYLRYNAWLFRPETIDAFLARFVERLRSAPLPGE